MAHELYLTLIVLATVVYATARALLDAADDSTGLPWLVDALLLGVGYAVLYLIARRRDRRRREEFRMEYERRQRLEESEWLLKQQLLLLEGHRSRIDEETAALDSIFSSHRLSSSSSGSSAAAGQSPAAAPCSPCRAPRHPPCRSPCRPDARPEVALDIEPPPPPPPPFRWSFTPAPDSQLPVASEALAARPLAPPPRDGGGNSPPASRTAADARPGDILRRLLGAGAYDREVIARRREMLLLVASSMRERSYTLTEFFRGCRECLPELNLYMSPQTSEGVRSADAEYRRTVGALFALYWLARLDLPGVTTPFDGADGQRGFCFGVCEETVDEASGHVTVWAPPSEAAAAQLSAAHAETRTADNDKRLRFMRAMDWSKLHKLLCASGVLVQDDGSEAGRGHGQACVRVDPERMAAMLALSASPEIENPFLAGQGSDSARPPPCGGGGGCCQATSHPPQLMLSN